MTTSMARSHGRGEPDRLQLGLYIILLYYNLLGWQGFHYRNVGLAQLINSSL